MIAASLTVAMLTAVGLPPDALSVSVRIAADALNVGSTYDLVVDLHWSDGVSTTTAGLPAPVLQVDAPGCVTLSGKILTDYRDLARNEFLQEPYERLAKDNPTRIEFTLNRPPDPGDAFAINVLAYVEMNGKKHFARRRMTIPIATGAIGSAVAADRSDWGIDNTLNIGEQADAFTLPRADGSMVSLLDYRGKKNVIVTTYRAFW